MKGCIFCNFEEIKQDVFWKYGNFFAKVGVGILGPGHVMLITKKHFSCFGELPAELDQEFLAAKENLFKKVKSCFSEPIVFEHGVYSQSVKHAHLHFLPKKSQFYSLEDVAGKVFRELRRTEVSSILDIKKVFREEGSYAYLEDADKRLVFHTKGLPESKFTFRKEFAGLIGIKGLADWRTMPESEKPRNREWIRETKQKLKVG